MAEIFISYARVDRERAQALAGALGREGWSIWWDRDIPPGRTFDEVIEEALTAAKCVIVLWSRDSVRSEWVKAEASDAARRRILVPVLADDVMPPLEFRRIQSAALLKWESLTSNPDWSHLCRSIGTLVGRPSVDASNAAPRMIEPSMEPAGLVGKRPKTWGVTVGVLGSCALVVVGGLAWTVVYHPFESAPTRAAASAVDPQPDSRAPADAHDAPSAPTHPAALESSVPPSVRVERPVREAAPAAVQPPRVTRPARELASGDRDLRSSPIDAVGLNRREIAAVALSARAAPTRTPLPEEGIADGGNVPEPVVPLSRDNAAEWFDVAYTRGVFRESGRVTVSPDGVRYVEVGGRSSVDAECGEVRRVQVPTIIVDSEQRMVELHLRDRVIRFTMAETAARNRFVSALSHACGTR
jgi:hypothetical protein